jgi:amino acid permease
MNNDIFHQIGQILIESNNGVLHRIFEWVGSATTIVLLWLGTVGGAFSRIFDPHTWDMSTIASFCSIPVAIMYFLAKYAEYKLNKSKLELVEQEKNADRN